MSENHLIVERDGEKYFIRFRWGVSHARDTYGYNTCSAYVDGVRVGACNGGGYDMQGTALEPWLERMVRPTDEFSGLSWHDPNYKTPKEIIGNEKTGKSVGLERYQDFYSASSKTRTERHTVPHIDGATGLSSALHNLGFKTYRWIK